MSEQIETDKTTENFELIREAQAGNREAMELLISQNMGLVKTIADDSSEET